MKISDEKDVFRLEDVLGRMLLIRETETALLDLISKGKVSGTVHTSLGQESVAVGVTMALNAQTDFVISNHRNHGHYLGFGGSLEGLLAEITGRKSGLCAGRGGSQHLCSGRFFTNGILGGTIPIAAGVAFGEKLRASGGVVGVFLGDGALGEGIVYESMNLVALWQLPVLFVVEDNGYAQTTPQRNAMAGSIQGRFSAFGIPVAAGNGRDVECVFTLSTNAVASVRKDGCSRCLVFSIDRLGPHSKGDDLRPADEMRQAWQNDPITAIERTLPLEVVEGLKSSIKHRVSAVMRETLKEDAADLPADLKALSAPAPNRFVIPKGKEHSRVVERLNAGLQAALLQDSSVFLMGEDIVDPYGGAFKVTAGLSSEFPDRVRSTPISEAGIVGLATGMALNGFHPVVEIMFGDFCSLIVDQVLNHASKFRWMYNEQVHVPLLIRSPFGGRRGYGPTHSQSIERLFLGMPGLRVVAISSVLDPADTLLTCMSQQDPVLLIENKVGYAEHVGEVPEGFRMLSPSRPLAPVKITPEGSCNADVTIVAYGGMASYMLPLLHTLREEEVAAELVVPQQLSPIDGLMLEVEESLCRTRRLLVCEEGTLSWGFGAEIIARLGEQEKFVGASLRRVAAREVPIPNSRDLEMKVLPNSADILREIEAMFIG